MQLQNVERPVAQIRILGIFGVIDPGYSKKTTNFRISVAAIGDRGDFGNTLLLTEKRCNRHDAYYQTTIN